MPQNPVGGTQIVNNYIHQQLRDELEDVVIWPTTFDHRKVDTSKINILHQHMEASMAEMKRVFSEERIALMDHIVFVSYWQYEDFMLNFPWLDSTKCSVIKNATKPFPSEPKLPDGKLKLIYTSTPFRGLELVPDIWKKLDRDDIELDVYSSLEIYGQAFVDKVHEACGNMYEDLFDELDSIDGINYKGYVTNDKIREACLDAHIYIYPAIIMETSCLSLLEGLAAGCAAVVTTLGALPETGSEYAYYSLMDFNNDKLIDNFTSCLNQVIDQYWSSFTQEKLSKQRQFYLDNYSWDSRIAQWSSLLTELKKLKQS